MGSADWDLIRNLDYPLWFVKPVDWKEHPVVVAAVDPVHAHDKPAHLDLRIIERARVIAEDCKGTLLVLHTYQTLDEIGSRATWAFKPNTGTLNFETSAFNGWTDAPPILLPVLLTARKRAESRPFRSQSTSYANL